MTANVIHRVFRIQWQGVEGTAFTIDVQDRQYLVTARHVVHDLRDASEIGVFSNGFWILLPVRLVGHCCGDIDISVLATSRILTSADLTMEPTSKGVIYGQDVYFLGFPYGLLGRCVFGLDGFPLPFVKRATVSLFDGAMFLLDGNNNPGFSGGPVVFTEPQSNRYKVAAVISGFESVPEPVYKGSDQTALTYQYNTGIIVTHAIDGALGLIEENPIGFDLKGSTQH